MLRVFLRDRVRERDCMSRMKRDFLGFELDEWYVLSCKTLVTHPLSVDLCCEQLICCFCQTRTYSAHKNLQLRLPIFKVHRNKLSILNNYSDKNWLSVPK